MALTAAAVGFEAGERPVLHQEDLDCWPCPPLWLSPIDLALTVKTPSQRRSSMTEGPLSLGYNSRQRTT